MNKEEEKDLVERTSKKLDKEYPDWYNKIDLQSLRMECCYNCVIGQLFGGYTSGLSELIHNTDISTTDAISAFHTGISERLWIDQIKARRAVDKLKETKEAVCL